MCKLEAPRITLVDVPDGKPQEKKESYINQMEADSMIDYYTSFL